MIPLRIVESDRDGFDEPVVEIWREDEFVGMVFWDEDVAVVQIHTDEDGDVFDLDLGEVFQVLGFAEAIVTPEEFRALSDEFGVSGFAIGDLGGRGDDDEENGWGGEHPSTVILTTEFDPLSAHRGADGEGFFRREVARDFMARCDEVDLAVVEMEGFDFDGASLKPHPALVLKVSLPENDDWGLFRSVANTLARDTLDVWPLHSSLVIAFVVQQPDGETFVA